MRCAHCTTAVLETDVELRRGWCEPCLDGAIDRGDDPSPEDDAAFEAWADAAWTDAAWETGQ